MSWQLGWVLCSPGWGIPSTPPGGRRTKVSAGWGGGHRERGVRGVRGAGGAWGGGGNTHIHYDSHASNESNKVKGESPTGKRKQTVLRRAPGSGREEDGPTGPASRASHPPGQLPAERVPPEPSPGQRDGDIRQEWGQGEGGVSPGLPEFLEQAGPVLVAAAAEPALDLAHGAAALLGEHLHVGLGDTGTAPPCHTALALPPSPPSRHLWGPPALTCLGCLVVAA